MRAVRARCLAIAVPLLATVAFWLLPAAAQADFGFLPGDEGFNVTATAEGGKTEATLSGSHPYSVVLDANFESTGKYTDGDIKDMTLDLPPGHDRKPDRGAEMQHRGLLRAPLLPVRNDLLGRELPEHDPDRHDDPRRRPTPARKPGRSASSTSPRRRVFPRATASPRTACRSRSPRTCAKPTTNMG